jgi:hypothetical protein
MPKPSLRDVSAHAIVSSIADAAERWSDADFPPRVRVTQAIEARLGYATPVVEYALDRLFFGIRSDVLEAAIAAELGSVAALDGPVPRDGRPDGYARGVDRVAIVSSDTTIGVALVPALYALCAKSHVVVKDRNDALVTAFFQSLVEERPEFAASAEARIWTGGDDAGEAALLSRAECVVAFGRDDTLRTIRAATRVDARFVPFGHRISIGYVGRAGVELRAREVLDGIASDALLYDQEGCLSLHALFLEGSEADARAFTAELALAFDRATIEFPATALDPTRAAAVAAYRNLTAFRAASGRGAVFAPGAGTSTIAFDPSRDQPPPLLPRVLPVYPVESMHDVLLFAGEHRLPVQAVGTDQTHDPAVRLMAEAIGAVRIAALGEMQSPSAAGHHGGLPRISDFVRWIDCE